MEYLQELRRKVVCGYDFPIPIVLLMLKRLFIENQAHKVRHSSISIRVRLILSIN